MKGNELVWRTLADHALDGVRRWDNLADLGFKAGVPVSTAHLATQRLVDIGAMSRYSSGGFSVVNPEKVLTLLCAWRNLRKDAIAHTTLEGFHDVVERLTVPFARGGPDAAIHFLGGSNTVADFSQTLAYVKAPVDEVTWPEGNEVTVLPMDERAALDWDGYSSVAQTYADLFATPGWQASEFRLALHDEFLAVRDWDQPEAHDGGNQHR